MNQIVVNFAPLRVAPLRSLPRPARSSNLAASGTEWRCRLKQQHADNDRQLHSSAPLKKWLGCRKSQWRIMRRKQSEERRKERQELREIEHERLRPLVTIEHCGTLSLDEYSLRPFVRDILVTVRFTSTPPIPRVWQQQPRLLSMHGCGPRLLGR